MFLLDDDDRRSAQRRFFLLEFVIACCLITTLHAGDHEAESTPKDPIGFGAAPRVFVDGVERLTLESFRFPRPAGAIEALVLTNVTRTEIRDTDTSAPAR